MPDQARVTLFRDKSTCKYTKWLFCLDEIIFCTRHCKVYSQCKSSPRPSKVQSCAAEMSLKSETQHSSRTVALHVNTIKIRSMFGQTGVPIHRRQRACCRHAHTCVSGDTSRQLARRAPRQGVAQDRAGSCRACTGADSYTCKGFVEIRNDVVHARVCERELQRVDELWQIDSVPSTAKTRRGRTTRSELTPRSALPRVPRRMPRDWQQGMSGTVLYRMWFSLSAATNRPPLHRRAVDTVPGAAPGNRGGDAGVAAPHG